MTDLKKLRELAEAAIASPQDGSGRDWWAHYDYDRAANLDECARYYHTPRGEK